MDILNKTTFTNGQNFKESNTSKNFLISSNVSPLGVKTEEFSEASKRHEEVKISYCACLGTCKNIPSYERCLPFHVLVMWCVLHNKQEFEISLEFWVSNQNIPICIPFRIPFRIPFCIHIWIPFGIPLRYAWSMTGPFILQPLF